MEDNINQIVPTFLIKNGFIEKDKTHFNNEKVEIIIHDEEYYEIIDGEYHMYSKDINIYWLIGTLTYHDWMVKNYVI